MPQLLRHNSPFLLRQHRSNISVKMAATLLLLLTHYLLGAATWHVKPSGSDANGGTSWGDAFQTLQKAIEVAAPNDEIWLAKGIYKPTKDRTGNAVPADNRDKTFYFAKDLKVFGGFPDMGDPGFGDRDVSLHETSLSGEFGAPGFADNAFHVVFLYRRTPNMVLDGLNINYGNADGPVYETQRGGGIFNDGSGAGNSSNPTLNQCIILYHKATVDGACMYNYGFQGNASPTLTDCFLGGGTATSDGGAMFNNGRYGISSPLCNNTSFGDNQAQHGACMYNNSEFGVSSPVLNDCYFSESSASGFGGAMYNDGFAGVSSPTLNNTDFGGNNAAKGGAIYNNNNASPVLNNCFFLGNVANEGGAIYNRSAQGFADCSPVLTQCRFKDNLASQNGGAIVIQVENGGISNLSLTKCTFEKNEAATGGVLYFMDINGTGYCAPTMTNCQFFDNEATVRGGVMAFGDSQLDSPSFVNCTFYDNTSPAGGVVCILDWNTGQIPAKMKNCIAWGNSSTFSQDINGKGHIRIRYSLIQEAVCPTGAVCEAGVIYNQNPLFVDAANYDLHLQVASPAANTGTPDGAPADDFDGNPRPVGAGFDMGAFENQSGPTAKCKNIDANLDAGGSILVQAASINNGSTGCAPLTFLINGQASQTYTCADKGPKVAVLKVTDCNNSTSTCEATITVKDVTAPTITCPANIVRPTDPNQCSAVVNYTAPAASDNCPGATAMHVSGGVSGSTFPKGQTIVEWKATDAANLTKTCAFTITVNDTQLPAIACPSNKTQGTDPNLCSAAVTYAMPNASDNCPGVMSMHVSGGVSGAVFPKGQTVVTWKATDAVGLTKTCTFRITVNDTQAPSISCPSNQSKNTDPGLCSAVATYATPTAMDNCAPPPNVVKTSGLPSGSSFPMGVNTVVWKATDGSGLTKTCSFSITVNDVQAPVVNCPNDIAVMAAPGQCSATVNYATPTASDNCGNPTPFLLSGLASGSIFPMGITNVVWRAIDGSGVSSTCAFTVTVSCKSSPSQPPQRGGATTSLATSRSAVPTPPLWGGWEGLDLQLAPNPATTEVAISVEGLGISNVQQGMSNDEVSGGELTMFDAAGRLAWRQAVGMDAASASRPLTLSLLDFPAGVYFVTLRADGQMVTKRLMVAR